MNRFFRTAYAATLAYLCMTLFAVLITGVNMPFPAFSCLYIGLLLALLPEISPKQAGREPLFILIGAAAALLGFLPIMLLHCPLTHYVVHLAGIAFAAAFCPLLRHRTTHSDFQAKYKFTVVLLLILIGFIILALLSGIGESGIVLIQSENVRLAINGVVPLAIVLLVTGVLLLRGLRAQEGVVDEKAFNRRQLRDTLLFAAIVTAVFFVDPFFYLKKAAAFLFTEAVRPAAFFLARMLSALLNLMACARPETEQAAPTPPPTSDPKEMPIAQLAETKPERYWIEGKDLSLVISYIFLAVAAVVLLVILALQIRKLIKSLRKRSKNRGRGYPHETRETIPAAAVARRRDKPKMRSEDPRERMRYLYAEFLRYLRRIPIRFGEANTCREIEKRAKNGLYVGSADLSDFSDLYEKARYRQKDKPTDTEARRMKKLLDRIKKRQKNG